MAGDSIKRDDIISDDALAAPLVLQKNLQSALDTLTQLLVVGNKFTDIFSQSGGSIAKLKTPLDQLSESEKQLNTIQNQIAVTVAKDNDNYIAQVQALKNVQAQLKNNIATSDEAFLLATKTNSSLVTLTNALNQNRIAYGALRTEQDRQSTAGKNLLKVIQDQDKGVKSIRESLGQFQDSVGNYKIATDGLGSSLRNVTDSLGPAGEKLGLLGSKAVNATTLFKGLFTGIGGVTIALRALAEVSVSAFFSRTAEGAKALTVAVGTLEYAYNDVLNTLSKFGQALVNNGIVRKKAASDRSKEEQQFIDLAVGEKALLKSRIALEKEESDTSVRINELSFQARNKLNKTDEERIEILHELNTILNEQADKAVVQAKAEYDNQLKQLLILKDKKSYEDLLRPDQEKLLPFYKAINAAENERYDGARRRQSQEAQIDDEIFTRKQTQDKEELASTLGLQDAVLQGEITKNAAILASAKTTEAEKLKALKQSAQDELAIAANQRALARQTTTAANTARIRSKLGSANFDAETPELQAEIVANDKIQIQQLAVIDQEYADKQLAITTKLTQDQTSLANEYLKTRLDTELKLYNAEKDLANARLQKQVDDQNKLAADSNTSPEGRLVAIQASADAQIQIAKNVHDKSVALAMDETAKKIAIEGYANGIFVDDLKQLNADIDVLEQTQADTVNKITIGGVNIKLKTITDGYANELSALQANNKKKSNAEKLSLEQSYLNGEIGVNEYRAKIQGLNFTAQQEEIETQRQVYQAEINLLSSFKQKHGSLTDEQNKALLAAQKGYNDATGKLYDEQVKLKEESDNKIKELQFQLEDNILSAVKSSGDAVYEQRIKDYNDQLSALQQAEQNDLAAAGDNANAKLTITQTYAEKEKQLQDKAKKAAHDQAVFDRDLALVTIALNTAIAISKAASSSASLGPIAGPIAFAAEAELYAAIGAVQAAAVLIRPIPGYASGTAHAPQGFARVAEQGPELVIDGLTGEAKLYDVPNAITYLNEGSQVFTAEETARIKRAEFGRSLSTLHVGVDGKLDRGDNKKLEDKIDKLTNVIKNKKELHMNITARGMEMMLKQGNTWNKIVDKYYGH